MEWCVLLVCPLVLLASRIDLDRQPPMFLQSICTFCTANKQAFKAAFVSMLQLAQHLRLSTKPFFGLTHCYA
jgi:hypothetical protein